MRDFPPLGVYVSSKSPIKKGIKILVFRIFSSTRNKFLVETETDFSVRYIFSPRNHVQVFSFLQSPPCSLMLRKSSLS